MMAMVLDRPAPVASRPLRLASWPDPEPDAGEIVVRVRACGVCRTDLHVVEGDLAPVRLPLVPGHQVVGTVERLGTGCSRFAIGDRVGIAWLRSTCGACAWCRSGSENLCARSSYTGWHEHGGYAERVAAPEAFAYRIPSRFSDTEAAPLLCAGIIGFRALARAQVPRGGRVGLFGFGSSAHVVIQLARHRGCEVFVASRGTSHRALAKRLGASWIGDTFDPFPEPVDGAIVFAPAGEIVPAALRAVRKGGTVALAGVTMSAIPEMDYDACLFHEKTLTSVEANTRRDGEALLAEAAAIPIRPETSVFPLEEAGEVLERLAEDRIDGTAVLEVR